MTSSVAAVAGGLVGLFGVGAAAAAAAALTGRHRTYLPGSHVALDAARAQPIARALRLGFASIEVAVSLSDSGVLLLGSESGAGVHGRTLSSSVIDPLVAAADWHSGRIHPGQSEPLNRLLRGHSQLFSRFRDGRIKLASVTVLLTGESAPRHLLADESDRLAFADGTFADLRDPGAPATLVPLLSEHWAWRFGWDGRFAMPAEERHLLRALVAEAHREGRGVRVYGAPQRPTAARVACWRELASAGVDLIGAESPGALARFLRRSGADLRSRGRWRSSSVDAFSGQYLLDTP